MTECFNTEFREKLPELAAETLEGNARAQVEEHVATCAACTQEHEMLVMVRTATVPVPFMNVAKIVRALPAAPIPVREELPWYRRASLLLAASLVLVAGGLVAVRQAGDRVVSAPAANAVAVAGTPAEDPSIDGVAPIAAPSVAAERAVAQTGGIAIVSGLDEMSAQELTVLLDEVNGFAAVPVEEPEQFSPVNAISDIQGEG